MNRLFAIIFYVLFYLPMVCAQDNALDKARRNFIKEFLTYYQEAYEKEDINFIESFFSANALVITETKQLSKCGAELAPNTTKKRPYKLIIEDKKTYIKRLKDIFEKNQKIKLSIPKENLYIHRHPKYDEIYGVSFLQMWTDFHNGSNIEDDMLGYVFLMIDFKKDEKHPTIHVRTWQPKNNIAKRTDKYNLMDFKIYDF